MSLPMQPTFLASLPPSPSTPRHAATPKETPPPRPNPTPPAPPIRLAPAASRAQIPKSPPLSRGTDSVRALHTPSAPPPKPSFRAQQADAFPFTFASCERVGLRREKSLIGFFLS